MLNRPETANHNDRPTLEISQYFESIVNKLLDQHAELVVNGPLWGWGDINISSILHLISPMTTGSGNRSYHMVYKAYDSIERENQQGIVISRSHTSRVRKHQSTIVDNHHYVLYEGRPGVFAQSFANDSLRSFTTLEDSVNQTINERNTNYLDLRSFKEDMLDINLSDPLKPRSIIIPNFLKFSDTLGFIQNTNREQY